MVLPTSLDYVRWKHKALSALQALACCSKTAISQNSPLKTIYNDPNAV